MGTKLTPHPSTWPFVTLIHRWIWILLERSLPNYIIVGNLKQGSGGGVLRNPPLSEEAAVWATVAAEVQAIAESSPYCDDELPKLGRWLCTRAIGMEFSQTRLNLTGGGREGWERPSSGLCGWDSRRWERDFGSQDWLRILKGPH